MAQQPLAEVFGYPIHNQSPEALRHRDKRLCPFNNKTPNCTKDKANDPLGVCSIYEGEKVVITCPVRFREDWLIADDAAAFFFAPDAKWTALVEVRLKDKYGQSAGNIDVVLVAYDERGKIIDFGSVEVQAVYISGNVRTPFEHFMQDQTAGATMNWHKRALSPRPDYLSSSRKRLAPQLLFKGGIFHAWSKKQAVVIHRGFYDTLPQMNKVDPIEADLAWLVYDSIFDLALNRYRLVKSETVYTKFTPTMLQLTTAEPGPVEDFLTTLQGKLDDRVDPNPPDAPALGDILLT